MTDTAPNERLAALSVVPGDHHLLGKPVTVGPCAEQRRKLAFAQAEANPASYVIAVDNDERVWLRDLTHGLGHLHRR